MGVRAGGRSGSGDLARAPEGRNAEPGHEDGARTGHKTAKPVPGPQRAESREPENHSHAQEQKANQLIPKGSQGFENRRDDVP